MALFCGAAIGFFRGNVLLIKDDLAALQPTIFPSVPRLFNKFHGRIQDAFDAAQVTRLNSPHDNNTETASSKLEHRTPLFCAPSPAASL